MSAIRKAKIRVGPPTTTEGDAANSAEASWILGRPAAIVAIGVDYTQTGNAEIDLTVKRDTSEGDTIWARGNSGTDLGATPLGSPGAIDEGQAATAATDATDGGGFINYGLHIAAAELDDASYLDLIVYYEHLKKKTITITTNGSGAGTGKWVPNNPRKIRFISVDYSASAGSSMTMTAKADNASTGPTLFTKDSNETDFGPVAVGMPGQDEGGAAIAATDGSSGGWFFAKGIYFAVASGGDTKTTQVHLYY